MSQALRDAAPNDFIALFRKGMEARNISLNQLAERAQISPASLSRVLNRQRSLPPDSTILRLAQVLDLQPPERALIAAGRIPEELTPMLRNPEIPTLLRATGKLSATDLQEVIKMAQSLALKQQRKRKRK